METSQVNVIEMLLFPSFFDLLLYFSYSHYGRDWCVNQNAIQCIDRLTSRGYGGNML